MNWKIKTQRVALAAVLLFWGNVCQATILMYTYDGEFDFSGSIEAFSGSFSYSTDTLISDSSIGSFSFQTTATQFGLPFGVTLNDSPVPVSGGTEFFISELSPDLNTGQDFEYSFGLTFLTTVDLTLPLPPFSDLISSLLIISEDGEGFVAEGQITNLQSVDEPSTVALFILGIAGIAYLGGTNIQHVKG